MLSFFWQWVSLKDRAGVECSRAVEIVELSMLMIGYCIQSLLFDNMISNVYRRTKGKNSGVAEREGPTTWSMPDLRGNSMGIPRRFCKAHITAGYLKNIARRPKPSLHTPYLFQLWKHSIVKRTPLGVAGSGRIPPKNALRCQLKGHLNQGCARNKTLGFLAKN